MSPLQPIFPPPTFPHHHPGDIPEVLLPEVWAAHKLGDTSVHPLVCSGSMWRLVLQMHWVPSTAEQIQEFCFFVYSVCSRKCPGLTTLKTHNTLQGCVYT